MVLVEIGQTVVQKDRRTNIIGDVESKRADSRVLLHPIWWLDHSLVPTPLRGVVNGRASKSGGIFIAGDVRKVAICASNASIGVTVGIVDGQFLDLLNAAYQFRPRSSVHRLHNTNHCTCP